MESVNIILTIVGVIILLFGLGTFLNPNFARLINVPGGPRLKGAVAAIVGIILIIIALFTEIPMD